MKDTAIRIPFCVEELDEMDGKTIVATRTETYPRMLLIFSDRTAAVIQEDTSGCYYAGEHGGMMLADPDDEERASAMDLWNQYMENNYRMDCSTCNRIEVFPLAKTREQCEKQAHDRSAESVAGVAQSAAQ
jgi:hypothetical protein